MKYYCDYCDTYLTHDSPSVRKTHCNGRKHKENVRIYYQKWLEEQVQKLVDDTTAAFKGDKNARGPQAVVAQAAAAKQPVLGHAPGAPMGPPGMGHMGPGPMMMGPGPPMMGMRPMGPPMGGPMGPGHFGPPGGPGGPPMMMRPMMMGGPPRQMMGPPGHGPP